MRGCGPPFHQRVCKGRGDVSLIGSLIKVSRRCGVRCRAFRDNLDSYGGAGHAVDGGEGGAAQGYCHAVVEQNRVEHTGKSHAARVVAARLRTLGVWVELVLATEAASSVPFGQATPSGYANEPSNPGGCDYNGCSDAGVDNCHENFCANAEGNCNACP